MLLTGFWRQYAQQPDAIALVEGDRSISYAELGQAVAGLANHLQQRGVEPVSSVAIHLPRGIDAVIAIFACLQRGLCYVPLDVKNPATRLAYIVNDAGANRVIGQGVPPDWLEADRWLDITDFKFALTGQSNVGANSFAHSPEIVRMNSHLQEDCATALPSVAIAAILYTSGSTGQPRGVALSHQAIAAFADWAADLLALNASDRIASSAPFFFDLSTFDLFAVLARGGCLYFVPNSLTLSPARLSAWLQAQSISGWYTVPSLLAFLAYKGNLPQTPLPALRFVLFAGEVFPTPALIELTEQLPTTAFYNLFGPTETNVCSYWMVDRHKLQAEQAIPIGIAASGCQLHIDTESGELWVRGGSLASGYWRSGQLDDLLNSQGWYATGDKVSVVDGQYHFHGRLGRMLKCAGYRVEPAEIEAVVNALPGVSACAVVGVPDPTSGQRPALAVVLQPGGALTDIRQALLKRLPSYMQPSRYLSIEQLPQLANGKLDFQRLQVLLEGGG